MSEAEALRTRYRELREQLMDIDGQLANRAVKPDGSRPTSPEYAIWRAHAVHNKQAKTRELVQIKARLIALEGRAPDDNSTRFWRTQAVGLIKVLEEIAMQTDALRASDAAIQAVERFNQDLTVRKEQAT